MWLHNDYGQNKDGQLKRQQYCEVYLKFKGSTDIMISEFSKHYVVSDYNFSFFTHMSNMLTLMSLNAIHIQLYFPWNLKHLFAYFFRSYCCAPLLYRFVVNPHVMKFIQWHLRYVTWTGLVSSFKVLESSFIWIINVAFLQVAAKKRFYLDWVYLNNGLFSWSC